MCVGPAFADNLCLPCRSIGIFDGAWCVGWRNGALKHLLDAYKFHSAVGAARPMIELLSETLPVLPKSLLVVPVPTASAHRRARGFDHMQRIAKPLARRRGLAYREVLERTSTGTQHFKNRQERLQSAASGLVARKQITGDVLLVDDIYTTGATTTACATLLKQSGANRVYLAVVARQALDERADL